LKEGFPGTLSWLRRTGGRLSVEDRAALVPKLLGTLPRVAGVFLPGLSRGKPPALDPTLFVVPDSRIAHEALEQANDSLPEFLLNHSHRSFLFGVLLAQLDGVTFDRELLFVACMLHDLGLDASDGSECFTAVGAREAELLAGRHGVESERAERMAEAITLHCNPGVEDADGVEARLIHEGAGLDVLGLRYRELDPEAIGAVLERHPRFAFKEEFARAWTREAEIFPEGRAHFLNRWAGFSLAVRMAPFEK